MATSGINRAAVDILNEGFEVSVSQPSSDAWSLGCDITIEDVDADIREIRLNDIAISGTIAINEASIDIDSERQNVLDLDVNVAIGGVNTSIVESQILTYDDIVKLSSTSTAVKNEKGFAASAWSVKKLLDKITPLEGIESISGILVNGIPYTEKNEDGLIDISEAFEGLSGGGDADLTNYYTIKQTQNYVKSELENYVKLDAEAQTIKGDIRIKGNLIVEGDTSSGGEGGTTNVGISGIVVNGKEYRDDNSDGLVDISKAFEGLDVDVDLSDYYTKGEIESKGYATTGYVDSKIKGIDLSKYAVKTEVDKSILTLNGAITTLDTKYASTKTWADSLASLIVNENGNVRIKANLIVNGDTSSGGEGGSTSVGITGILLNGTTYRDENSDGIIDLGTITSGLTSVDWDDIQNKPVFGTLAYKNGLTASDVGALSVNGGTIDGSLQIGKDDNTSYKHLILSRSSHAMRLNNVADAGYISFGAYSGGVYTAEKIFEIGDYGLRYSANGGSTYYTLYHSGNFNPANYLPLTGGTITGNIGAFKIKRSNGNSSAVHFQNVVNNANNDLGGLGFGNDGKPYVFSPDYSTKSEILTSAGGTISGTTTGPLVINTTNATEVGIPLAINSSKKVWFGYSTAVGGAYMYNAVAKRYMGILDDGSAFLGGNTILHSGNIGEYNAGGIINKNSSAVDASDISVLNSFYDNNTAFSLGTFKGLTNIVGTADGVIVNFPRSSAYGQQWFIDDDSHTIKTRYKNSDKSTPWSAWKTIAFTDSTVDKAKKLVDASGNDAVTIGTNKDLIAKASIVLGNSVSLVVTSTDNVQVTALYFDRNNNLLIGKGTNTRNAGIYMYGSKYFFKTTASETNSLIINESGNVTIGRSDLASTTTKLYVDGGIRFAPRTIWGQSFDGTGDVSGNFTLGYNGIYGGGNESLLRSSVTTLSLAYGYRDLITDIYGGTLRFLRGTGNTSMLINSSGNATIGATDLASTSYKLYVSGHGYFAADTYLANWAYLRTYKTDGSVVTLIGINNQNQMFINGDGSGVNTIIRGGNVLIGTTTDSGYKLDVAGHFRSTKQTIGNVISVNRNADSGAILNPALIAWKAQCYDSQVRFSVFKGDGTATYHPLILTDSGNVGVGTTSPAYKLDVNGDTRINGALTAGATTINGNATINGNLVVQGDISA